MSADLAVEFLETLWGKQAPGALVISAKSNGSGLASVWHVGPTHVIGDDLTEVARERDVYVSCAALDPTREAPGKRGSAADVVAIPGCWLDLDAWNPEAHKGQTPDNCPPDAAAAAEALQGFDLPPTLIVGSGNGIYGWWLFDRPMILADDNDRARARRLVEDMQAAVRHHVQPWTVDPTHDLARILRPPGTNNWKQADPKPVTTISCAGVRYGVDLIEEFLRGVPKLAAKGAEPGGGTGNDDGKVRTGGRHHHIARAFGLLNTRGLSVDAIEAALVAENESVCEPPLDQSEVRVLAHDLYERYQKQHGQAADDWPVPVPLDDEARLAFPTNLLPAVQADVVEAVSEAFQAPPDLAVVMSSAAVAAAVAKRVRVQIKAGWEEPLNVYFGAALKPGEAKSPVAARLVGPLQQLEQEQQDEYRRDLPRRLAKVEALRQRAKTTRSSAHKELSSNPLLGEDMLSDAITLEMEADEAEPGAPPRMLAEDATAAAMAALMGANDGRIAFISDEGGVVFSQMLGRFGNSSELELFLKGHDGRMAYISDRVGRGHMTIDSPTITMGLAFQPKVLSDMSNDPEIRGRGMWARFWYAVPHARVGYRDVAAAPAPDAVLRAWEAAVTALGRIDGTHVIRFDRAARERFDEWRAELEPRQRADGDLANITDWTGKLAGQLARQAGRCHLLEYGPGGLNREIGVETVERALGLSDYLIGHAKLALGLMGFSPGRELARRLLRWLAHKARVGEPLSIFDRRDAYTGLRVTPEELEPALRLLCEFGWLREQLGVTKTGRKRVDAATYRVNPAVNVLADEDADDSTVAAVSTVDQCSDVHTENVDPITTILPTANPQTVETVETALMHFSEGPPSLSKHMRTHAQEARSSFNSSATWSPCRACGSDTVRDVGLCWPCEDGGAS